MIKFKIGINTLFLIPEEVGGSEIYLIETLKALLRNFGEIHFTFFTNSENDIYFRSLFKEEPRAEFVPLKFPATNRSLRILKEQTELPVAVTKSGLALLWSPGYTFPLLGRFPKVVSILDMQYKNFPADLSFLGRAVMDFILQCAVHKADAILTLSEFSKTEILKYTAASSSKIFVAHLAADPDFANLVPPELVQKTLAPFHLIGRKYILCVAHSYPHKNIPVLIRAFGALIQEIPHQLVIVGKARRGEHNVQDALRDLPPSRIIRIPQMDRQQLIVFYQKADSFVFPSLYEGFGLPVAEAMMAGTPVITTRSASIPEIMGDAGIYFDRSSEDLAQKIHYLIQMPSYKRQALIEKAKERIKGFSWDRTAAETYRVFQSILFAPTKSKNFAE